MPSSLHRFLPSCLLILCSTISAPLSAAPQREPACSGPISGQTAQLTGQVLDSTGAVLPGVAVTLLCGSTQHQVTTGAEGRFTLQAAPGSYQLRIRKPEFASASLPITIAPGAHATQDVTLQPAGVSDAITVTAGGFEQIVREAPASVTVIQRADLQTRRVADLAQALIDVEGVDVGQNVGKTGGLTISMRGMPSDYTLMLIDGRRQNAPGSVTPNGFGETATSFMPPVGAIERIEVVRGPMSTLYGSDSMGGVVNVITRKVSERWTGTVSADGTFQTNRDFGDTRQGNFYLSGPLWSNRLGLAVRGNAFRRDAAALQYETVNGQPASASAPPAPTSTTWAAGSPTSSMSATTSTPILTTSPRPTTTAIVNSAPSASRAAMPKR